MFVKQVSLFIIIYVCKTCCFKNLFATKQLVLKQTTKQTCCFKNLMLRVKEVLFFYNL